MPDNSSTYNRVVLGWAAGTALSVSSGAQVYYHRPTVDNTNNNIYTVSNSNITIIDTMATQNDNASIAVDSVDTNKLVFLFPEVSTVPLILTRTLQSQADLGQCLHWWYTIPDLDCSSNWNFWDYSRG